MWLKSNNTLHALYFFKIRFGWLRSEGEIFIIPILIDRDIDWWVAVSIISLDTLIYWQNVFENDQLRANVLVEAKAI